MTKDHQGQRSAVSEQDGRVFLTAIKVLEFFMNFCTVSLRLLLFLSDYGACYSRSAGGNFKTKTRAN